MVALGTGAMQWVLARGRTSHPVNSSPSTSEVGSVFRTEPKYVGSWTCSYVSNGNSVVLARDIKPDGSYVDYTVQSGTRRYDRNGVYSTFGNGQFSYSVNDGDAAGHNFRGSYHWDEADTITLTYPDGTALTWRRKR